MSASSHSSYDNCSRWNSSLHSEIIDSSIRDLFASPISLFNDSTWYIHNFSPTDFLTSNFSFSFSSFLVLVVGCLLTHNWGVNIFLMALNKYQVNTWIDNVIVEGFAQHSVLVVAPSKMITWSCLHCPHYLITPYAKRNSTCRTWIWCLNPPPPLTPFPSSTNFLGRDTVARWKYRYLW